MRTTQRTTTEAAAIGTFAGAVLAIALAIGPATVAAHGEGHRRDGAGRGASAVPPEQKDWGIAGDPARVTRTISITMSDRMRFDPASLRVRQGETIRLRVRNVGKLKHELVIGTTAELEEHAALMTKFPDMEHDEPWMIHVDPGRTGELVWTFNRTGSFRFGCLIAGHFQSGMVGDITVIEARRTR